MFGRDARDPEEGGQPAREGGLRRPVTEERRVAAWIGASLVIQGDLSSSEDMTIAGRVEGDVAVRNHTLVVAPGARIQGNIIARAVAVHGEVTGTINAGEKVDVGASGVVHGDIRTPRMVVTEGATLHGKLRVSSAGRPERPAPEEKQPKPTSERAEAESR